MLTGLHYQLGRREQELVQQILNQSSSYTVQQPTSMQQTEIKLKLSTNKITSTVLHRTVFPNINEQFEHFA